MAGVAGLAFCLQNPIFARTVVKPVFTGFPNHIKLI